MASFGTIFNVVLDFSDDFQHVGIAIVRESIRWLALMVYRTVMVRFPYGGDSPCAWTFAQGASAALARFYLYNP